MDRHQSFDSLQFDDHQIIDYEIKAICSIDQNTPVVDWKWNLCLNLETSAAKFESEACGEIHLLPDPRSLPCRFRRSRLPPQYRLSRRSRFIQSLHPGCMGRVLYKLRILFCF